MMHMTFMCLNLLVTYVKTIPQLGKLVIEVQIETYLVLYFDTFLNDTLLQVSLKAQFLQLLLEYFYSKPYDKTDTQTST